MPPTSHCSAAVQIQTSVTDRDVGYELTAGVVDLQIWLVGESGDGYPNLGEEWQDGCDVDGGCPSYEAQGTECLPQRCQVVLAALTSLMCQVSV